MTEEKVALKPVMGFRDLLLFYIVTGFSVRWIAQAAHGGPSALVIWLVCCVAFYVPLVVCVLQLSSRFPGEGGIYIWSQKAFGGFAGFMTAWMYWVSNLPYFPALLGYTAINALYLVGPRGHGLADSRTYFIIASLTGLSLAVWPNVLGLRIGKWLHNAGAIGLWLPALVVIVLGLTAGWRFGSATPITARSLIPSTHLKDIVFWSTIAFSLSGLEAASIMGDEIHDARRNIPRALLLAGAIITVIYVLATLAVMEAVPAERVSIVQGIMDAVTSASGRLGIRGIGFVVAFCITIGGIGQAGAWFAAAARLPFVAGIDSYLPAAFGRVHPRWGSPYVALIVQAMIAVGFILMSLPGTSIAGAYDVLVAMSVLFYFIPYLFMFGAMIRLRGTLVLALMGLTTTALAIVLSFVPTEENANWWLFELKVAGSTVVMLLIGAGLYLLSSHRRISSSGSVTGLAVNTLSQRAER
jgi:amino acid transporter